MQGRALRRRRIKRRGLRGEALGGDQGQCGVFVGAEGQAQALALAGLQAERLASGQLRRCLLYTSPSPRDYAASR
ncbi:hypothetical protein KZ847_35355, partial [Pseudomonas aeruginosa]